MKYLPIDEFSADGYLSEVNRRFLHPLGLALEWASGFTRQQFEDWVNAIDGVPAMTAGELSAAWAVVVALGLDKPRLTGVWDCRDDPEGIRYEGVSLRDNMSNVRRLWDQREKPRRAALGYMVQPPETGSPPT